MIEEYFFFPNLINDLIFKITLSERFLMGGVDPLVGRDELRSVSVAIRLNRCIRSRTLSCSADDCVVAGISSSYFFSINFFLCYFKLQFFFSTNRGTNHKIKRKFFPYTKFIQETQIYRNTKTRELKNEI